MERIIWRKFLKAFRKVASKIIQSTSTKHMESKTKTVKYWVLLLTKIKWSIVDCKFLAILPKNILSCWIVPFHQHRHSMRIFLCLQILLWFRNLAQGLTKTLHVSLICLWWDIAHLSRILCHSLRREEASRISVGC